MSDMLLITLKRTTPHQMAEDEVGRAISDSLSTYGDLFTIHPPFIHTHEDRLAVTEAVVQFEESRCYAAYDAIKFLGQWVIEYVLRGGVPHERISVSAIFRNRGTMRDLLHEITFTYVDDLKPGVYGENL